MAGPIAHIICALAILNSGALKIQDEKAFILGNCYPDIDYIGVVKRDITHYPHIRWEDVIAAPTDFQKGVLLHSLVDEVRIAQLEKPNEESIPHLPIMRSQIMKFFEDALLYPQLKAAWPRIAHYFDKIILEEKAAHHLTDGALTQWHHFIKTYCTQEPTVTNTHALINQFPQLRARIPVGLPSLISKVYIALAFRSFKRKSELTRAMKHFYENSVTLVTSNAHLAHRHLMVPA